MLRHIIGKRPKVGLALGSGAAKGLAHIGVLKVLEKNKIIIDEVAGTSMGALIGALYCSTKDSLYVETIAKDVSFNKLKKLVDIKLSKYGLVKGDKLLEYLNKFIKHKKFEELQIPLSIVAADIVSGNEVVFDKGDLFTAIRSSISIPIVFNPVTDKNRILADGGLLNPVPIDILFKKGCDFVIGVDFGYKGSKDEKMGTITMMMNIFMMMQEKIATLNANCYNKNRFVMIQPQVDSYNYNDFDKADLFIKIGELEAARHLPLIKKRVQKLVRYRLKNALK